MIIKNGTNPKIEAIKKALGISGDVYIDGANHIETLQSHHRLLSDYNYPSTATTIEEAEAERAAFEAELERRRQDQPEADLTVEDTLRLLGELGVNIDD